MHAKIRDFHLNGEMHDVNIVMAKERLVRFIETQMREEGCVPVLDLEPQFTLSYLQHLERYQFKLTVYGTYVGKERAWYVEGVTNGKMMFKSTHPARLREF